VAAYVIDQGEVLDPERYEEYKVKTMQAALDWYRGAEYTAICNIREGTTPPAYTWSRA
jgi:uncharacterized protein (DUF1330 family)